MTTGHHAVTWERRSDLSTDSAIRDLVRSRQRHFNNDDTTEGDRRPSVPLAMTLTESLKTYLEPCVPMSPGQQHS